MLFVGQKLRADFPYVTSTALPFSYHLESSAACTEITLDVSSIKSAVNEEKYWEDTSGPKASVSFWVVDMDR